MSEKKLVIAVQSPVCIFANQEKNFNGYNFVFIEKYCDVIYVRRLRKYWKYRKRLIELGWNNKKLCLSDRILNKRADILVCFNGCPYAKENTPPENYHGKKIYHVMDFVFFTKRAVQALVNGKVNYLMGYCEHDKESDFFRKFYSAYINKVIPVPFGYGKRFQNKLEFAERINKAVAVGSVNPVDDPLCPEHMLDEYVEYYKGERFTHKLRRAIVKNRERWKGEIDDLLPTWPETKNPDYDPVEVLNQYTMFINDAGIMNFPPARTYEGIACGCVMVAADLHIYHVLGFEDGVNAILFRDGDYEDMIGKIEYYQQNPEKLEKMQKKSMELAEGFTHEKVADELYRKIHELR